jgi:hypothetical protein
MQSIALLIRRFFVAFLPFFEAHVIKHIAKSKEVIHGEQFLCIQMT